MEVVGILENGILVDCGGKKEIKEKEKEYGKGNYSLGRGNEK